MTPPPPAPKPRPALKPTPAPDPALVILSGRSDVYSGLAELIRGKLGPATGIFTLPEGPGAAAALATAAGGGKGPIIALGLEAARNAAPFANSRDVLFALVFSFREYGLLERGMIGISLLPPPRQTLRLLQELNPAYSSLAVATGHQGTDYLKTIGREAERLGMSVTTREVTSDKELLLFASQLNPAVSTFWLLPDNRILSREIMQQLLATNVKNGRATIVFSPELLKYGGLVSAQFDPQAIADTVAQILALPAPDRARMHGSMQQPSAGLLAINGDLARTFGLKIPPNRRKLVQEPR